MVSLVALRDTQDSMAWVKASTPVAAVSAGGIPYVSRGSRMAISRDKIHGNDEQFLVGGFLGDDRRSRNLAPRTRRRRNGDDRNAGMRHPAHARVIPDSPAVGVEQAHGLGNVDGPPPPQATMVPHRSLRNRPSASLTWRSVGSDGISEKTAPSSPASRKDWSTGSTTPERRRNGPRDHERPAPPPLPGEQTR